MRFWGRSIFLMIVCVILAHFTYRIYNYIDSRESAISINKQYHPVVSSDGWSEDNTAVFWFMQISDLHFSQFDDPRRVSDLDMFCKVQIPVLRPEVVLVTGDLVDAKTVNQFRSMQYQYEWEKYRQVVRGSGVLNHTRWLDLRGNHDAFDVPSYESPTDFFSYYSVQGSKHKSSYLVTINKPFGNYSFVVLDATPTPGLKRPFNFFGYLSEESASVASKMAESVAENNHSFWFAHYPTSSIVSPYLDLRKLLGNSAFAYFCGHYHTFYGRMRELYALQPQGYLELELGDWRSDRYYRIVAVDNDLVSFVDRRLSTAETPDQPDWPVILITNPKSSNFLLPHKEPVDRIALSKHIRVLAWSPWPIKSVTIFIDDTIIGQASPILLPSSNSTHSSSPLFALPWKSDDYADGKEHTIDVVVEDTHGNSGRMKQTFIVNGQPNWKFEFHSYFLYTDFTHDLCFVFMLGWFVQVTLILLPRIPLKFVRDIFRVLPIGSGLYQASNNNTFFLLYLTYLAWVLTLPTFIAFVVQDYVGVVFSFGIFVDGKLSTEPLTYYCEILQMTLFCLFGYIPSLFVIGMCEPANWSPLGPPDKRPWLNTSKERSTRTTERSKCNTFLRFALAAMYTILQFCFHVWSTYAPYGKMAMLIAPGRILPSLVILYLLFKLP